MRVENFDIDGLIRAELDYSRPERSFDMSKIETRVATLRWRGRTQLALLSVAAVIAVVVALAATAPTGTKSVNVANNQPGDETPVTIAGATTTTRATTTTVATTPPRREAKQPGSAIATPPGDRTPDTIASPTTPTSTPTMTTPTTVSDTAPTTNPTPTTTPTTPTTVNDPYPPVPEGSRRMIITVNDDGVHAPATFRGDKPIQIIFADQRTVRPDGDAMLYSPDGTFVWAWDGTKNEVATFAPAVGTWELMAADRLHLIEKFAIEITAD